MKERPEPKRLRNRLAKSELWIHLAVTADRWASEIDGSDPGVKPFDEWEDDALRSLALTYDLTAADLARLARQIGAELENRAMRAGYEDAWVPGRP